MSSTSFSPRVPISKQVAWTAAVAIAGVSYFAATIVVLHFLRPDLNPISRPTSEYAVGPDGWLMTSAFFSLSVASFALIWGLTQAESPPARSRIGLGLLGLGAIGLLIAMIFPIDLDDAPQTLSGSIHAINGPLTFLSLTAGALLVSRHLKHDKQWRPLHLSALILSLVMLAAFVATPLSMGVGFAGLAQRIYLVIFVTWFLLTATHLRTITHTSVSA